MKSGIPGFPFFTTYMILLVTLAFMFPSAALCHRLYEGVLGPSQRVGFMFNVQKQPVLVSGSAFWAQKPHLDTRTESHQGGRKSTRDASTSSTYLKKNKGFHGGQCSCCVTVNIFITTHSIHCVGWYTSKKFR